ncbi:MAG: dipicolinate synthase subunit B [Faecalibacterium sp.]|nr:dipicolinate synthase subunit B [Ruminococcus sp.]MCM1391661.1 dipicolinate synthase subunit B [Ruminococcus sp.]MCM1486214.1 dipicolinate synthase subunit B [Faecalibacterium sp.]
MKNLTYGYAITGSFCTFEKSIEQIKNILNSGIDVIPIMSSNAYSIDTRFGTAESFIKTIEKLTGKKIISTLTGAEPIGPKKMCDLLIVSPCTGNTLAKLANGVYDTPVTLAVKSHLRNKRPVLIGVSSNDSLSSSAKNIGQLLNYKHYYFIPMRQDDSINKPFSIVCDFAKTLDAAECALKEEQMQPILI